MKPHQIASLFNSTAVMTCIAAVMLGTAGSAAAVPAPRDDLSPLVEQQHQRQPQQLSEHGGQQAEPQTPQQLSEHGGEQAPPAATVSPIVGDTPSERVAPTPAPSADSSPATSDDGNDNAPWIIGASLLTVALLGSGMYVTRRRRHVAPGH
jgi:hypothetical protein